jgi:hypothetical protein
VPEDGLFGKLFGDKKAHNIRFSEAVKAKYAKA